MRRLLSAHEGCTVEELCAHLRITHNAVRQHLSALLARGYVGPAQARPSGGRPRACYRLTGAGLALFPRNYAVIATALLAELRGRLGDAELDALLQSIGRSLGEREQPPSADAPQDEVARILAAHLDALGYEALAVPRDGELQIEAFNCVFHAMAQQHPQVCKFDLAYMEAASGRRIHHMECIVRGGSCCRFRLGKPNR
jgi:predicted ArsR family transcriptional regulator